jgi:hypothetical protein
MGRRSPEGRRNLRGRCVDRRICAGGWTGTRGGHRGSGEARRPRLAERACSGRRPHRRRRGSGWGSGEDWWPGSSSDASTSLPGMSSISTAPRCASSSRSMAACTTCSERAMHSEPSTSPNSAPESSASPMLACSPTYPVYSRTSLISASACRSPWSSKGPALPRLLPSDARRTLLRKTPLSPEIGGKGPGVRGPEQPSRAPRTCSPP